MVEKEKIDLQSKLFELMEEKNELKLVVESKNAAITKLQKQIFEVNLNDNVLLTCHRSRLLKTVNSLSWRPSGPGAA